MKKQTITKQITTKERETLDNLMELVLDKYKIEDIVFSFLDKITDWRVRDAMVTELLKDENVKDNIKDELQMEILQGKFVVTVESMAQYDKLTDFVCTNIYPSYNDQQHHLFS